MSFWRRIFTAPGNPRVWLSLALYGTALVAILVYRDRIGQKAASTFTELTAAPPASTAPQRAAPADSAARARWAARLRPGERERALFVEARGGSEEAARRLRALLLREPSAPPFRERRGEGGGAGPDARGSGKGGGVAAGPRAGAMGDGGRWGDGGVGPGQGEGRGEGGTDLVVSPALAALARASLESGPRATRALAAGLLLAHDGVLREVASVRAQIPALRERARRERRRVAITRVGWLGLLDLRSRGAERELLHLLVAATQPEARAEAARALGRIGDAAFHAPLLQLVVDRTPVALREAALGGLVDLGLCGVNRRSRVLRSLAAVLADKNVTGAGADAVWRALRRLAAEGRSEAHLPGAPGEAPGGGSAPEAAGAPAPPRVDAAAEAP